MIPRAEELLAGDDPVVAAQVLERDGSRAPGEVVAVLLRLPAAPAGGGRVGQLVRDLDAALR